MLKFKNPYFKAAGQKGKETNVAKNAPLIDAWLKTKTDQNVITLAEIKAALPAIAGELDRESANMISQALGLGILNPEDQTP